LALGAIETFLEQFNVADSYDGGERRLQPPRKLQVNELDRPI